MSYLELVTGRRDFVQAQSFLVARRFMHHVKKDPLALEFRLNVSDPEYGEAVAGEMDTRYMKIPVLHGFTAQDLTIVQYGRMVSLTEKGLTPPQQKRWQALEAELLMPPISAEFYDALLGNGNYSPDEMLTVIKQFNNPHINEHIEGSLLTTAITAPIRERSEKKPQEITKERAPTSLTDLSNIIYADPLDDSKVSPVVHSIDDYIVGKLLQ